MHVHQTLLPTGWLLLCYGLFPKRWAGHHTCGCFFPTLFSACVVGRAFSACLRSVCFCFLLHFATLCNLLAACAGYVSTQLCFPPGPQSKYRLIVRFSRLLSICKQLDFAEFGLLSCCLHLVFCCVCTKHVFDGRASCTPCWLWVLVAFSKLAGLFPGLPQPLPKKASGDAMPARGRANFLQMLVLVFCPPTKPVARLLRDGCMGKTPNPDQHCLTPACNTYQL